MKLCPMKSGAEMCFYNPNDSKVLAKHKIEVWPGYAIKVEDFEGGIYFQVCSAPLIRY